MKKLVPLFLFAILFVPLTAYAQPPDITRMQGLGNTKYHRIEFLPLKQTYHIFVRLPEKYDAEKLYPTVYLLDGGHTFPMLGAYYRYLNFSGEVPDMIIVGVSYGTDDRQKGNQRGRDFTASAKDRNHYGGARQFSEFFRSALFPLIEKKYRSDPERRIVFGQSLGGQFAIFAAQVETGLFFGHIASNPALHRNLDFYLQNPPKGTDGRVRIYVSRASNDEPRFFEPAGKWVAYWTAKKDTAWHLKTEILQGQNHFSAAPESFRRGLEWVLKSRDER